MPVLFRSIGPVFVDVVVEESLTVEMEVPEHPVENGAAISDHAYRKPTVLTLTCANQNATASWRALMEVMAAAEPFDIVSGFDVHRSMLLRKIEPKRDLETASILSFEAELKEVIVVDSAESGGGTGGQKTASDDRGKGTTERGQVQTRPVNTTSGRGEQVLDELSPAA